MIDMLEDTITRLEANSGNARKIAERSGLAYDTVLRIKRRQHEPRYGNLKKLWDVLVKFDAERGK